MLIDTLVDHVVNNIPRTGKLLAPHCRGITIARLWQTLTAVVADYGVRMSPNLQLMEKFGTGFRENIGQHVLLSGGDWVGLVWALSASGTNGTRVVQVEIMQIIEISRSARRDRHSPVLQTVNWFLSYRSDNRLSWTVVCVTHWPVRCVGL
jgi:hypothetical protein